MRWDSTPAKDLEEWHQWFAWYPVKTTVGTWVWLELVLQRQLTSSSSQEYWEYE
jgi:hypothetical protein